MAHRFFRRLGRIRYWLPRSMSGLIAGICLVASVPLLAALIMAGVALERLSSHSDKLIDEGVTLERLGSDLHARINSLERNARQYVVVGDPALLELFSDRAEEAREILVEIENGEFRASLDEHVEVLNRGLGQAVRAWADSPDNRSALAAVIDQLRILREQAAAITTSGGEAIDAQVEALQRSSANARRIMLLSAVALVPLTALLAIGSSAVVARPLRSMNHGIQALGRSQYDQPIDISFPREMRHLGRRLDWLRRRLAELDADKEQFLRHVSHQLKTPLASMREGVSLLREGATGQLAAQQMEVVEILDEATTDLDTEIRKLLAFAKWREGFRESETLWFDAGPLIEEVLRTHKPAMIKQSISAEVRLDTPRIFGVREHLRVALENLVANAIRHGPTGTAIEIHVGAKRDCFELSVRDHGPGISPSSKRRIFEAYVRGEDAREQDTRGSGLGLSIVEEIVLAHGGLVEVEDAHPGTRFRMLWPGNTEGDAGDGP